MSEQRRTDSMPVGVPETPTRKRRLLYALALTSVFLGVEVVGGVLSGSLALLADAAHMLTDVGALILSYAAATLAERPSSAKHTFGLQRAEILAAFVNAQVLLVASGFIFYEAYQRLSHPPEIATGLMMGVAIAGLAANLVSVRILHGGRDQSLNIKAAYLEVFTDMLGSLGVIGAAFVIGATGWYWVDAVVSAGIGLFIVPRTLLLLRESTHVLLEGTPVGIDLAQLRGDILAVPGVEEVHDLHIWTLTSGIHSASAHVRVAGNSPRDDVLRALQKLFRERARIDHATIQIEWGQGSGCDCTEHTF
jgi:cobalt-zinc-cadmium efflux system protein